MRRQPRRRQSLVPMILHPAVPLELQEALKTPQDAPGATTAPGHDSQGVPEIASFPQPHEEAPGRFGEHEAILQAFCTHLLQRFDTAVNASVKDLSKGADEIYGFVHQQLQIQREKAQHAETYLDTLTTQAVTQGIQLRSDPYSVTVQTMSPQGFPVTLALHKQDKGELVEELGNMVQWLAQHGYKPVGAGL